MGAVRLSGKGQFGFTGEPFIALLGEQVGESSFELTNISECGPNSVRLQIGTAKDSLSADEILLPTDFRYLSTGDLVRLNPVSQEARVLYRRKSRHNVLFFTERCNSRCLMCSQPPRDLDDSYLTEDILRMIPWMSKATPELGITGGEPTLVFEKLVEVIESVKTHLPQTSLHMLSNGRRLAQLRMAKLIAEVAHPNFMIGIPLYADVAPFHDFVVQAKGAFEETLFGLMNLARVGIRIELRMVIHQHTFRRLPQFARFVARNLPFVDQVVFMGLELTGFARTNLNALWVDPLDYQAELEEAVQYLDDFGLKVLIFNHQLCLLRPSLIGFARKSISDWKNTFLPECGQCILQEDCGGFFASSSLRVSQHIRPILSECSVDRPQDPAHDRSRRES